MILRGLDTRKKYKWNSGFTLQTLQTPTKHYKLHSSPLVFFPAQPAQLAHLAEDTSTRKSHMGLIAPISGFFFPMLVKLIG